MRLAKRARMHLSAFARQALVHCVASAAVRRPGGGWWADHHFTAWLLRQHAWHMSHNAAYASPKLSDKAALPARPGLCHCNKPAHCPALRSQLLRPLKNTHDPACQRSLSVLSHRFLLAALFATRAAQRRWRARARLPRPCRALRARGAPWPQGVYEGVLPRDRQQRGAGAGQPFASSLCRHPQRCTATSGTRQHHMHACCGC